MHVELFYNSFMKDFLQLRFPCVMGILNVTPNSFSDGGQYFDLEKAVARGLEMVAEGAQIIDIGGESTGPNSVAVDVIEERARVMPVLKKLTAVLPKNILLSVDTWKAEIAREALESGAHMINDVTALRGDPQMASVLAAAGCPVVLMYAKDSTPRTTREPRQYTDVIQTVREFLQQRIEYAVRNGIAKENIILDAGMGAFVSGDPKYSFEILQRLQELTLLGCPILVGASRKSFLGGMVTDRLQAGLDCAVLAVANGASIIRTHDVKETICVL